MLTIRKADDRGHADHGWLNTHHTFSFASYRDPAQMGFRSLRVMNEDRVAPGMGFGTHAHSDMEIVSYVLSGALEHKDSMGNGEVLRPGEFQRITAGTGITHSEFNPSQTEPTHFYQIWLLPAEQGLTPSYEQKEFNTDNASEMWRLVASPDGADDSLTIHQNAYISLATIREGEALRRDLKTDRYGWLQVLRGAVTLNGHDLETSDGVAISEETELHLTANREAEVMLFDLA